jgi:hypothetical protein
MRTSILIILALGIWAYNDRDSFDQATSDFAATVGLAVSEIQAEIEALERNGTFDAGLFDNEDMGPGFACSAAVRPGANDFDHQSVEPDIGNYSTLGNSGAHSGMDLSQLKHRVDAARLEYDAMCRNPYMANSVEATRLYQEFQSLDQQYRRALHGW